MANETWLPCQSFDGFEASTQGRVRPVDGEVLKPWTVKTPTGNAYLYVRINGRNVHAAHAVLDAFECPRPPGLMALHANDVGTDNRPSNLRWGNRIQNWDDALKNGRSPQAHKTKCPAGHKYDIFETQRNGRVHRGCSKCRADTSYKARVRAKAARRARRAA